MLGTNKCWKLRESHWTQGKSSTDICISYEYINVYSSKKQAIERMKEIIEDWVEWMEERKDATTKILLETTTHITAMSYDAKLDAWSLIDIILNEITVG